MPLPMLKGMRKKQKEREVAARDYVRVRQAASSSLIKICFSQQWLGHRSSRLESRAPT